MKHKLTDNSFLGDKVALRLRHIPIKRILTVLDCYHGIGTIWKNVQEKYSGKISIVKIDKIKKDESFQLVGDNIKYLNGMDLSRFDVVDLDAYGIPFEQLKSIFKKNTREWFL